MIPSLINRLRVAAAADRRKAVALSAGVVAAAALVRLLLEPLFADKHVYIAFYPAVILATYVAGRRAGLVATAVSVVLAYWMFETPEFQFKLGVAAFTPAVFFSLSATLAVYVIAGLNEALVKTAREQGRAEAAARHNADLFRELNERVAHHLQLVAGVLALQADRAAEVRSAQALAKASETSLLLARAHRDCAGRTAERVEFLSFARHLVEAKLASRGAPSAAVSLSGDPLDLPADQATSLGAALLECLDVLLSRREPDQRLGLELGRRGEGVVMRVSEFDEAGGATLARLADGDLLRAVIGQLGARLALGLGEEGGALEIRFQPAGSATTYDPAAVTLH